MQVIYHWGVCSCSSPVPPRAPNSQKWEAYVPPGYMATAPLPGIILVNRCCNNQQLVSMITRWKHGCAPREGEPLTCTTSVAISLVL